MGDRQQPHQGAVLQELEDLRLVGQAPGVARGPKKTPPGEDSPDPTYDQLRVLLGAAWRAI